MATENPKKIICEICGELTHSIQLHLSKAHPDISLERYQSIYPGADILSEHAKKVIAKQIKAEVAKKKEESGAEELETLSGASRKPLNEVFGLGKSPATLSSSGKEIMIMVRDPSQADEYTDLIPEVDDNYIWPIDTLKNVLMAFEENMTLLLWGHAGVGKSTIIEQVCARTNRPYMRVQHTANTEESHVVGQTLANEKGTYFEPGPLTLAMLHGWVYLADEYDFAHASVTAVYQPVLEGKALIIKEAPKDWRVIKPHPNFRFVATGNTNGSGDETGNYIGTNVGNAANYSRFMITDKVEYMEEEQEVAVIVKQADVDMEDASVLVKFAKEIRESFDTKQMTSTIGPRELISAAKIGMRRGSFMRGLKLAYINRLSSVDALVAEGIAQRLFGDESSEAA